MRANGQMTTYPFEVIQVPTGVDYPSFSTDEMCDWNISIEPSECTDPQMDGLKMYFNGEWNTPNFKTTKETTEDGFGGEKTELIRVDRIYSFETTSDNYALAYMHEMLLTSSVLKIEDKNGFEFDGREFNIKYDEISRGIFKVKIEFIAILEDTYHGPYGMRACCKSLYENSPYEGCAEDVGGEIDNEEPMCDDIIFSIMEVDGTLTATAENTPSTFTIGWYYRKDTTKAWHFIENGTVLSVGQYGIYRAVMNALGCGQYVDQYIYVDPCNGYDVRIRKNSNNTLIAEATQQSTYVWEINDGNGWVTLPDTSNSIVATESGVYRVTASSGDCEDSDALNVQIASACDFDAEIQIVDQTATAITTALTPLYQWLFEDETGSVEIGTNNSIQLTKTGIYWLSVIQDECVITKYKYYKSPDNITKIEVINWDEMPMPQTTLIACCDDCPSLSLSIACVNRTLTISGLPQGATIDWIGPNGFTGSGNSVSFTQATPSGLFTANIDVNGCPYVATYSYTKPNAGTPNQNQNV